MNKTDYKDMWVFIERDGDSVLPVSLELCSETRKLCDASGEKLVAAASRTESCSACSTAAWTRSST